MPSHDPPGAKTFTVQLILKHAGDANQLYKKALGATELSRIEASWRTTNYELERRR